jgi:hypothetical protein
MTEDLRPAELTTQDDTTEALGLKLDMVRVKRTLSRLIENRMKSIDRFNRLSLFGEKLVRAKKDEKDWTWRCMPGDDPIIQMILNLVSELETAGKIEDERLRVNTQCNIRKELASILATRDNANAKLFSELVEMVEQEQRVREHNDNMRLKAGEGDDRLTDAELLEMAQKSGPIDAPLPGRLEAMLKEPE